MIRSKITVVIPCKNEMENIDACIASARLLGDEVLVADSGSSDGTLEFARQHADRVIEREYIDSGDFKNWAIPQAAHDWVFVLDADERITHELAAEIHDRLKLPQGNSTDANSIGANSTGADSTGADSTDEKLAYQVRRQNFFLGHPLNHGDWARDEVTRLLRRDHCRYALHTDHAEIGVEPHQLGRLKTKLVHYTAWDLPSYLQKMHHYAMQQAVLWHSQGRRSSLWSVAFNGPLRFLRGYMMRSGFRDGTIGFFVSVMTGYYSFLKQFMLWQLNHGKSLVDADANYAAKRSEISDAA